MKSIRYKNRFKIFVAVYITRWYFIDTCFTVYLYIVVAVEIEIYFFSFFFKECDLSVLTKFLKQITLSIHFNLIHLLVCIFF